MEFLKKGTIISFGNSTAIIDCSEPLGRGSTCVAYKCRVKYQDSTQEYALLKAFLPRNFDYEFFGDGYSHVLPAQLEKLKSEYNKYIESLQESRSLLLNLTENKGFLKNYCVIPPAIVQNKSTEKTNFYFDEEKFCAFVLYPYDSEDIESNLSQISLEDKIDLLAKICLILKEFHNNGFILTDLNPHNFLFEKDEIGFRLKLFDFDSVKKLKGGKSVSNKTGTRFYSAPEVIQNTISQINFQSDYYSIGALLSLFVFGNNLDTVFPDKDTYRFLAHLNQNVEKMISLETLEILNSSELIDISIGMWNKFKEIIQHTITLKSKHRYKFIDDLYNDLIILKEIYQNKGVHPEVMLDNAKNIATEFKNELKDFDEGLLCDCVVVDDETE